MTILAAVQELFAEGPYAGIPIVTKDAVYHIGDFNNNGDGVHVYEEPLEGSTWYLARKSGKGRFMNMFAAIKNKAIKSRVASWVVNNGWATQGKVWEASWYDDESGSISNAIYWSKNDADKEHWGNDEVKIKEIYQLVATPKLQDWFKSFTDKDIELNAVESMLFFLFARDQTDFDGVWWNERNSSTAHGSIFQDRLENWEKKKIKTKVGELKVEKRG